MKINLKYSAICLGLILGMAVTTSCERDNYDEPEAKISGQIYDNSGNKLQTAIAQNSMKIKIVETSYSHGDESIVVTPQYLNMGQDGSFVNNKLFAGTYTVAPVQGPFFEAQDEEGVTQTIELKNGKMATLNFSVTPYLDLQWVKKPYIGSDGKLYASFVFTRNHKDGYTDPNLSDCCIWVSHTQYCGPEGDSNYTPGTTTITADMEGQEIELCTKEPIKYAMHYWVRIGARCNDTYKTYNYTTIEELDVTSSQIVSQ